MAAPTVIDAAWTFDDQNTAQNGRYVIGSIFQNAASATASNSQWRDGVIPGVYSTAASAYQSLRVTENSPTGSSVLVQPGHAIVTRTGQGVYVCPNSTARVVALDAADATNPRIDLIVLQVLDQPLGDSVTQVQIRSVTGLASGSPSAPATPTGAIVLARVAVAAAPTGNTIVNANITDYRRSAGVAGTVRPLLAQDAVGDAGQEGDLRYQASTFERYNAALAAWQPYAIINGPFGYVAKATFTSDDANLTSGTTELMTPRVLTFAAKANRRYRVTGRVGLSAVGASQVVTNLRWATGGTVTTSGTLFGRSRTYLSAAFPASFGEVIIGEFAGPAVAGNVTVGISITNTNSSQTRAKADANEDINYLLVEDIGGV